MIIRAVIVVIIWVLAAIGIAMNAHDQLWQLLRAHGLGGHAIGLIFVWLPLGLLALEWIVLIGAPVMTVILFTKRYRMKKYHNNPHMATPRNPFN